MTQLKTLKGIVGKTVASIDESAINCVTIKFTDGTVVVLEAEHILPSVGLIGVVPYDNSNS